MNSRICKALALIALVGGAVIMAGTNAFAQRSSGIGVLRLGVVGGVNYSQVSAPMQNFVNLPGLGFFTSSDFSGATGTDGYVGVVGEYGVNDMVGLGLRVTYDARKVMKSSDGNTFTPRMVYTSIEPDLRLSLGGSALHAMVGPTIALTSSATYDYNPAPSEFAQDVDDGRLENVSDVAVGARVGLGYDIRLSEPTARTGLYLTPFVEGSYLFDQKAPDDPSATDESWNTLTGRAGLELKVQF